MHRISRFDRGQHKGYGLKCGATFPKKAGFPLPGAAQGYGRAKMVGQSASLLSEIPPWSDKVAGRRARGQLALQQQRRIGAHTWRAQRPWRLPGGCHRQPGIDVTLP